MPSHQVLRGSVGLGVVGRRLSFQSFRLPVRSPCNLTSRPECSRMVDVARPREVLAVNGDFLLLWNFHMAGLNSVDQWLAGSRRLAPLALVDPFGVNRDALSHG